MKRKCRNVDITDKDFVVRAINDCMSHKSTRKMSRHDISRIFDQYKTVDAIADLLIREIRRRHINVRQIRYEERVDRSNGKRRIIAIEDIKQQFYDYIAYNALEELDSYIGHYQIACREGMGPLFGAKVAQQWMREKDVRYAIVADIRKCYPSITHGSMMAWLREHVANDALLWLIGELLKLSEEGRPTASLAMRLREDPDLMSQYEAVKHGLPIGSYLSIKLCALYIADIYHRCEGTYFSGRRGKRRNIFAHVMINLDDIYLFGSNASGMHRAMADLIQFAAGKGLTIKPDWRLISLNHSDPDAHVDVLGYRVYRDRITMRPRNYRKLRHSIRIFRAHPTAGHARSLMARHGMFILHTNARRFCNKYNVYQTARKARKVISRYDKSKVCGKAGACNRNADRRHQLLSDLPA